VEQLISIGGQPFMTAVRLEGTEILFVVSENAEVQYASAGPGQISGVLQVNGKIPPNEPSGAAVRIELIIGPAASPAGVSIAIK
jgi:uncharacterized protein (TIGR03437 family)